MGGVLPRNRIGICMCCLRLMISWSLLSAKCTGLFFFLMCVALWIYRLKVLMPYDSNWCAICPLGLVPTSVSWGTAHLFVTWSCLCWMVVMCMFTLDNLCVLCIIVWCVCTCMSKTSHPHLVTTWITRPIFAWS